ncbi:MAG: peptide-methionine (R)-S-oxide reductase MsrB [Gemmatimonadetes bacterium]|nr:peptide-methionine (R)-S-oxide reductase MsrB [Gemmatimonadota bacterium]
MKTPRDHEHWRSKLTPEQFRVAREGGTERAFTGIYHDTKDPGTYRCICCGAELFRSEDKFDSGCGWPSFTQPYERDRVRELEDLSHGMRRVEIRCAACDAHLGHVFPDGPRDRGGMRYCINSASLNLERSAEGDAG